MDRKRSLGFPKVPRFAPEGDPGEKGATGAAGPTGATGATGEKGATGVTGATGAFGTATVVFTQAAADLPDGTSASYQAFCPSGKQGIAGGARGDATDSEATSVTSSRPSVSAASTDPPLTGGSFTGWRITARNLLGGVTVGIRPEVWVVCVPAPVA